MGVAQLAAGVTVPRAAPVLAVGQAAIDLTPTAVKTWATSSFGTADKDVLLTGVVAALALLAVIIGMAAVRRLAYGMGGLAVLAAAGAAAAVTRPGASPGWAFPVLIGAGAGAFALTRLTRLAHAADASPETASEPRPETAASPPESGASATTASPPTTGAFPSERRQFLVASGVTLAAAAVGGAGGQALAGRRNVRAARTAIRFPPPAVPAPPLPAGADLPVPGISPFITPNGQFYRVDTALVLPQVDPSGWHLRIHGMVDRELTLTFDDLLRRPLIEDYVTLCCVSNPVSGPYIGNAKWLGASLGSLLRRAGIRPGASQLLCTSADGFTSGTPAQVVMDGRDALVAVAMNGAALPAEHGFPARLVVPGLYGYVSACKWVTDIEVTTFEAAQGYWIPRGWSQQAPVKTESRIDVPGDGSSSLRAGRTAVAGVAWAQHKGIESVEVRVDGGPWHPATLAAVPGLDTWRQWAWEWDAAPGTHRIEARATDKTGYTQTSAAAGEVPDGAAGYPRSTVTVR